MERLLLIAGLFVVAGLCEIGGGYLVWSWMREHKPLVWALLGAAILAAYGVVPLCNPSPSSGECTPLTEASLSHWRWRGASSWTGFDLIGGTS